MPNQGSLVAMMGQNGSPLSTAAFRQAAQHILSLSDEHLAAMIDKGQFSEVDGNG